MAEPGQWVLHVKHGTQNHELRVPVASSVAALQEQLQELTGFFVRKQKLIFKGKVLSADHSLAKAGLTDGAKLMLLLSGDAAAPTQGQQALQLQKQQRQEDAAQRVKDLYAKAKGMGGATAAAIEAAAASVPSTSGPAIDWQERKRSWHKTGIISLRDLGLAALPADLFADGLGAARVADLSHNALPGLPASLAALTGLHTLRLAHNRLTTEGVPWDALAALSGLTALSLDANQLDCIPEGGLAGLAALQVLSVCGNRLTALPEAVGGLAALQVLAADGNRLAGLPGSVGGCTALQELSAEGNQIRQLPESLARLQKLQSLRLDGNRIRAVPPAILSDCACLASLSLQGNPITADQLRCTPGFALYDARRVARCNKQLEAGVLQHAGRSFTEGAEDRQWSRWAGAGGKQK